MLNRKCLKERVDVKVNKYKYWKHNIMLINYKTVNTNREIAVLTAALHTGIITKKGLVFR